MFSLGGQFGYMIPSVKVINPVDRFLLFMQPLFPLDFAIYFILVLFLTSAASSGCQWIGIGFPWIKVYQF
jgi:LMBR1 domain-containing protein 1